MLDVLTTMPEDTADNHTIQHGDQSELRPTPWGRPEATRERVPRRPPHSSSWTLKVTHGGDVRRISLCKSHATPYRDVLSGVSDLFRVPPSRVESSFLLKYRDHEGDICTLNYVMFSDALPVFATDHTIRPTAAATGQQVQLTSTRPP